MEEPTRIEGVSLSISTDHECQCGRPADCPSGEVVCQLCCGRGIVRVTCQIPCPVWPWPPPTALEKHNLLIAGLADSKLVEVSTSISWLDYLQLKGLCAVWRSSLSHCIRLGLVQMLEREIWSDRAPMGPLLQELDLFPPRHSRDEDVVSILETLEPACASSESVAVFCTTVRALNVNHPRRQPKVTVNVSTSQSMRHLMPLLASLGLALSTSSIIRAAIHEMFRRHVHPYVCPSTDQDEWTPWEALAEW